jgi:hypothetical protein
MYIIEGVFLQEPQLQELPQGVWNNATEFV